MIKEKLIQAKDWIKDKAVKLKRVIVLLVAGGILFAAGPTMVDVGLDLTVPSQYRLKAQIERIGPYRIIKEVGEEFVVYAYASEQISEPFENEILELRTNSTIVQQLEGNKRVATSFFGQKFYRETKEDSWHDVSYHKTQAKYFFRKISVSKYEVVYAADTGWKVPSADEDDYSDWSFEEKAYASDDDDATASTTGDESDWYNFAFGVPGSATIDGIEVVIEAQEAKSGTCEVDAELSYDGGANYTTSGKGTGNLTTTDVEYTLGGAADTWGRSWTDTEFSDANFRIKLYATVSAESGQTARVDAIKIKVYYTAAEVGTNMQINIGDAWKDVTLMKINIGDAWKDVAGVQVNIGDAWKTIY